MKILNGLKDVLRSRDCKLRINIQNGRSLFTGLLTFSFFFVGEFSLARETLPSKNGHSESPNAEAPQSGALYSETFQQAKAKRWLIDIGSGGENPFEGLIGFGSFSGQSSKSTISRMNVGAKAQYGLTRDFAPFFRLNYENHSLQTQNGGYSSKTATQGLEDLHLGYVGSLGNEKFRFTHGVALVLATDKMRMEYNGDDSKYNGSQGNGISANLGFLMRAGSNLVFVTRYSHVRRPEITELIKNGSSSYDSTYKDVSDHSLYLGGEIQNAQSSYSGYLVHTGGERKYSYSTKPLGSYFGGISLSAKFDLGSAFSISPNYQYLKYLYISGDPLVIQALGVKFGLEI